RFGRHRRGVCASDDYPNLSADQFERQPRQPIVLALGPAVFGHNVLALDITVLLQALMTSAHTFRKHSQGCRADLPDHWHQRVLRARHERPRCCAANQRDEAAARSHSITSSARATSEAGTSMPSACAVARLMTNSNLVGCTTGRSAGLTPLRMRAV